MHELLGGKFVSPYEWFLGGWVVHLGISDDAVDDVRRPDFELVSTGQRGMPLG